MEELLSQKIGLTTLREIVLWASQSVRNKDWLWEWGASGDRRTAVNSLWVLTHLPESDASWLSSRQIDIIDRLLIEKDTSKKRIYLQLLRKLDFDAGNPLVLKLLDYCLSKINSECEPYAIRCFSMYVAFRICRDYPELVSELEQYLDLLSTQPLSPGLKSGLRQTRQKISRLKNK